MKSTQEEEEPAMAMAPGESLFEDLPKNSPGDALQQQQGGVADDPASAPSGDQGASQLPGSGGPVGAKFPTQPLVGQPTSGRLTCREWVHHQLQQQASMENKVLFNGEWMDPQEARKTYWRMQWAGIRMIFELIFVFAFIAFITFFVYLFVFNYLLGNSSK